MGFSIANLKGLATPYAPVGTKPREDKPKGGDRKSAGGSSYDRAKGARQQTAGSDMASVYEAYRRAGKPGGMTRADAAQYEHAVNEGHVMLPRGGSLRTRPAAPVLPAKVVAAYNSHAMDDDPAARAEIKRAVEAGEMSLPRGMRLEKPAPRSTGERIGMGLRSAVKGIGQLADMSSPLNILARMGVDAAGGHLPGSEEILTGAADALGASKPESDTELLTDSIIGGAAQGLVTGPVGGLRGIVGRTTLDVLSGGAAGGAQESARQAGAGPVGQVVAGLAGGAAPVGLAAAGSRIRAPKNLPEVVADIPRAAVIDETGNLTPEGQEFAARHSVTPEEIVAAYEAPPKVRKAIANEELPVAQAREATTGEPVAEPTSAREAPPELPPTPNEPDVDQRAISPSIVAAPDNVPATALERVQQGREVGVDYSRGQATKSFDIQDAESRLRNSNGPEAEEMRAFVAKQTEQVKTAVDEFKNAFGDKSLSTDERGTLVQEAIRELRDNGQKGVTALYQQAKELGQEVPLETAGISKTLEGLMAEADIPETVKKVMEQEAARYGLIGKPQIIDEATGAVTNEANVTTVKLDDGQTIKFRGEPQTLRLDNAEALRQVISKQYMADGPLKLTRELKTAIDDATEAAATKLAQYGQEGAKVPKALDTARQAHVEQVQTFKAKDIVQAIADWKKGTLTGSLKPEQVMQQALAKASDLRRLKAVLLTKPTVKSKAAWTAIQAHGLADLFGKAATRNTNAAGEITDAISGAKLRSAIEDFGGKGQGSTMLKILLDPDDFNRMMKLRRTIEDVTIPISGSTNPSGSGNLIMRLARDVDNQVTAAFSAAGMAVAGPAGAGAGGMIGRAISPAIKEAKQARANAETLKGATEYTPEQAAGDTGEKPVSVASKAGGAVKQAGSKTLRAFIDTYSSPRILAPVLASQPGEPEK